MLVKYFRAETIVLPCPLLVIFNFVSLQQDMYDFKEGTVFNYILLDFEKETIVFYDLDDVKHTYEFKLDTDVIKLEETKVKPVEKETNDNVHNMRDGKNNKSKGSRLRLVD